MTLDFAGTGRLVVPPPPHTSVQVVQSGSTLTTMGYLNFQQLE